MSEETPADETTVTAEDIKVEVTPEPTTWPLFKCPRGHEQRGSGETKGRNYQTGRIVGSGPVCTECWLPSLGERFPTFEVKE